MKDSDVEPNRRPFGLAEQFLQMGLMVLLVVWTFHIVRPFVVPVAWGVIIAVTLYPIDGRIEAALGGRRWLAAALTTVLAMALLIAPTVFLGDALVATVERLVHRFGPDGAGLPPLPAFVADLPLVGDRIAGTWTGLASGGGGTSAALERHLKPVGEWLLTAGARVTFGTAQFVTAILIAGVIMAQAAPIIAWSRRVVLRLAPDTGVALTRLAESTIRNVSRGVLGVALIQALAAGIAFMLVGIPAAGLWALLCFILAVVQIGVLPITGPVAVYALFNMDLVVAIPFTVWCGFIGVIDNFLKPVLLHRGLQTPLWVIALGSIGGLLASGVIGLFIGPVLLVLAYEVGRAWLDEDGEGGAGEDSTTPPQAPGA